MTTMITNAAQARELSRNSDHPKLQQMLETITYWASQGRYSIDVEALPEQLKNNLVSRGFSVRNGTTISW